MLFIILKMIELLFVAFHKMKYFMLIGLDGLSERGKGDSDADMTVS